MPPYTVSNASGISEWLMLCALRHPNGNDLRRRIEADDDIILRVHYTPWDIRVVYSEPQILSDLPKAEAARTGSNEAAQGAHRKGYFVRVSLRRTDKACNEGRGLRACGRTSRNGSHTFTPGRF